MNDPCAKLVEHGVLIYQPIISLAPQYFLSLHDGPVPYTVWARTDTNANNKQLKLVTIIVPVYSIPRDINMEGPSFPKISANSRDFHEHEC